MITPQQIDQISFSQARHGYDMEQVDKILEPLTEDYVALYKENALLKSKMRVLVGKLEEYRKNEAAAKDALDSAKRSAEQMMQEAEAKCAQMMRQAQAAAAAVPAAPAAPAAKAPSADAFVAVENARVAEARKTAAARITEIQTQMQQCIQALDRIKNANVTPAAAKAPAAAPAAPAAAPAEAPKAAPKKAADVYDSEAVAGEISQSLEAMVGTTNDTAPKAAPQHPTRDTSTSRFSTLNLQFGRNYDPTQK
ncbi:MAG: DivIVA domain-containing protein [Firmicutes bacterium]|nr:DivIVA domain-containing protein [Bacillota bacterium]MDY6160281.1 DivIVA domain-containing protein [Candidatus Faecousia sp.]